MLKRALVPLLALVVIVVGGALIARSLRAGAVKAQLSYRIAPVKSDTVKKTVTATGVLKAWTTVDIKSKAGGRIDRLPVDEGTIVKKNQLIAEIDPSDTLLTYNSAKADIDSNRAKVEESGKSLTLQQTETRASVSTAEANLHSAQASALAAKARADSAASQAKAQQELTEANIDNANATLESEAAHMSQMMTATNPQSVVNADSQLGQSEATLKNAEAQLNRQKALLAKGFVAVSAVDQAQATYDVARATVLSARQKVSTIKPELESDVKAQQARVRQAQAALRTAQANRVEVDLKRQSAEAAQADYQQSLALVKQAEAKLLQARAEIINNSIRQSQILQAQAAGARARASMVNAQTQLDQTHVTAPSEGIILKKYVEEGTLITSGVSFNSSGTSIVQMGDITRMYVDVQVDETDVAGVDLDQKVDITFDAYSTTPFEGKVIKIDPEAVVDQNVTTIHVRVEVDNSVPSYRLLKPGMNASCEFIVNKKENVVSVPNESLKTDDDGKKYVEVAEGGKPAPADKDTEADPNVLIDVKVIKKPVEIGLEGNDTTEITSGLKENERLITQTIEPITASPGGGNPFSGSKGPGRK